MASNKKENTRQHAVALRYAEDDRAPKVVATGAGELAKRILELAHQYGVPVRKDDSLVQILSKLQINAEIPVEAYKAVAEILAFLFRTDIAWRKKKQAENARYRQGKQPSPTPQQGRK